MSRITQYGRSLPRRRVAGAGGEQGHPPSEPRQQLVRLEQRHPDRRELDCEWQAVEPSADLAHRRRRAEPRGDRARPLDEEHRGVVLGQRLTRVSPFRVEVQRLAARDQHLGVGGTRQEQPRRPERPSRPARSCREQQAGACSPRRPAFTGFPFSVGTTLDWSGIGSEAFDDEHASVLPLRPLRSDSHFERPK
jgi:hypothetical protein